MKIDIHDIDPALLDAAMAGGVLVGTINGTLPGRQPGLRDDQAGELAGGLSAPRNGGFRPIADIRHLRGHRLQREETAFVVNDIDSLGAPGLMLRIAKSRLPHSRYRSIVPRIGFQDRRSRRALFAHNVKGYRPSGVSPGLKRYYRLINETHADDVTAIGPEKVVVWSATASPSSRRSASAFLSRQTSLRIMLPRRMYRSHAVLDGASAPCNDRSLSTNADLQVHPLRTFQPNEAHAARCGAPPSFSMATAGFA